MQPYQRFIRTKRIDVAPAGFSVDRTTLNPKLFDWQREVVQFALERGRFAIFAECGLGKTPMQLEWARHVVEHTRKPVLILCPLAVAQQTRREAAKFDIAGVHVVREQSEIRGQGIFISNYERLDKFDCQSFSGVVLDESSILKGYTGATKRLLIKEFRKTDYKLCCTATPAPNDLLEMGNHVEFLGLMPSNEMIARWFINDSMHAGNYRLKRHAERDFWRWVSGWAVSMEQPSDLGNYEDGGFVLPSLQRHIHVVDVDRDHAPAGFLFHPGALSATGLHQEKRLSAGARAECVAELVNDSDELWIVWCDTNYEADELQERIPDCIEVRGSDSVRSKEQALEAFSLGQSRVIVTKPEIGGFGLNWQHCHNVAFTGLSYSFERYYQAVRRSWRFGQTEQVQVHIVASESEASICDAVFAKEQAHERLQSAMVAAVREDQQRRLRGRQRLSAYRPEMQMEVPAWLQRQELSA